MEAGGPQHKINSSLVVNKQLAEIDQNLQTYSKQQNRADPLICYLHGVICK